MNITEGFEKCNACKNSTSNLLCYGCVHNRDLITLLQWEVEKTQTQPIPNAAPSFWFQITGLFCSFVCFAFVAAPLLVCGYLFRRKQAAAIGLALRDFIASFSKP